MIQCTQIKPADVAEGVAALEILAKLKTGKVAYSVAHNLAELRKAQRTLNELSESILEQHAWRHKGKYIFSCIANQGVDFDPAKYVGDGWPSVDDIDDLDVGDVFSDSGCYHEYVGNGNIREIGAVNIQSVCMRDGAGYQAAIKELNAAPVDVSLILIDPASMEDIEDITAEAFWMPMLIGRTSPD